MSRCILTKEQIDKIYKVLEAMPKTYETDGMKIKPVGLKMFNHNMTAYIVEADISYKESGGKHPQAFGYIKNESYPDCSEWGYISIEELINNGFEMDLYFENKFIDSKGNITEGGAK